MILKDEDEFLEAMARTLGMGMPRMAGRLWAYLAICDPPEQTAAQIAERLQASRGSVSGMARLLEHVGLIRRVTHPGDRRESLRARPRSLSPRSPHTHDPHPLFAVTSGPTDARAAA